MIRALFDTNVFISAILFGGVPGQLLDHAIASRFKLVTSPILLDELDRKFREKFHWNTSDVAESRHDLERLCEVVSTTEALHIVLANPDDDRVLEAATAGRADCIVSGDKHLLSLGSFRGIPILTARQFLDILYPTA